MRVYKLTCEQSGKFIISNDLQEILQKAREELSGLVILKDTKISIEVLEEDCLKDCLEEGECE